MTRQPLHRMFSVLAFAALSPFATAQTVQQTGGWSSLVMPQTRAFSAHADQRGVVLESVVSRVEIREHVARTTLDLLLRNPTSRQDDAILLIPVPTGAVVSDFGFEGQASEPTTQVISAEEARRMYDSIVARVKDPALLEFAGYNAIRSSVFPVPAQGTQRIRLTYENVLDGDGDRVDYVLPRSEMLEHRVPWRIGVEIESREPISMIYSPSHAIITRRIGPNRLKVTLSERAVTEPGSFRLSYLREREGVSISVLAYPDPSINGGYFLLMGGVPATADAPTVRREVTLVLDRSGSMAGPKLEQALAATLQVVEGLEDGETFNIIDYATNVQSFAERPVVKSAALMQSVRHYLSNIRPGGGTNIHDALVEALRARRSDPDALPMVLFLTDGLPTIGRTTETEIRALVETANPHGRRIFTFGVGADVNAPLLDRLADASRATASYVLPGEDVEVAVTRVFRRLRGPVMAEPTLATAIVGGRLNHHIKDLAPAVMPDLFDGDQLIVLGRYVGGEPVKLLLRGTYLGKPAAFEVTIDPARASTRHAFVPRLWASRHIAELIDLVRQGGASGSAATSGELVDEIVRLSTRFGILTEYTSFLATEGTDLGNHAALVAGCAAELNTKAVQTRWGASAVYQATANISQKRQTTLNYRNSFRNVEGESVAFTGVQQMCDRAFFRRGNRWIDANLAHRPNRPADEVIVLGSEAHRKLLERVTRAGKAGLLALKGEILLLLDGRTILIKDGC